MLRRTGKPFLLGPKRGAEKNYIRDKPQREASERARERVFHATPKLWFEVPEILKDEWNSIFRNFRKRGQSFESTYTQIFGISKKNFGISSSGISVPIDFPPGIFSRMVCCSEIQIFSEFLQMFLKNVRTICLRFEIFGILG